MQAPSLGILARAFQQAKLELLHKVPTGILRWSETSLRLRKQAGSPVSSSGGVPGIELSTGAEDQTVPSFSHLNRKALKETSVKNTNRIHDFCTTLLFLD